MYILEEKIYLWCLLAIPFLIAIHLLVLYWRKRTQKKFALPALFHELTPNKSNLKSTLKMLCLVLAVAFLSIALVNPKLGTKLETVKREGVDIVFALDVSKSMLAEDITPNRLDKSKRIISEVINNLSGDRVGLIGYAGSAFPQVPITTDYSAAKNFLRSMNTSMVSSQGTATREAVRLANRYFDNEETSKVLILVTDGEDHEADFEAEVMKAAEQGINIIAISTGTERGGPIPIRDGRGGVTYKKDRAGETVITRADIPTLKRIAELGNGIHIDGSSTTQAVESVLDFLNDLEKTEFEAKEYANYQHHFQWFLLIGIIFIIFEALLLERKTGWLSKLNLFNENENE
ncbi:MAG: VWA domain-containing protein [Flavobacteriaceae bacterium]|nr:VWA domain-containing protein [Flavobacteriaceae bacterium]